MKKFARNIFSTKYGLLALSAILLISSFVFSTYYSSHTVLNREKRQLENYINEAETDFEVFLRDTSLLKKLVQQNETLAEFNRITDKNYGIFILAETVFGGHETLFWSKQAMEPPKPFHEQADGRYFRQLANGYYLLIKQTFRIRGMSNTLVACAMIPVKYDYFIETDYLPPHFVHNSTADERVIISREATGYPVLSVTGETIFYLDRKTSSAIAYNDTLTIALRFAALILLVIFIHLLADSAVRKQNPWRGVALLVSMLFALRMIIYLFPGLFNFRQFQLFDPSVYASSIIHPSLGDLLINAMLFCWISLFAWIKLGNEKIYLDGFGQRWKWIIGFSALLFLILSTFSVASIIRSLVADSKISFDVTNFFSLDEYSVIGFVILACLSLGYYYFTRSLFRVIFPVFEERAYLIYFAIAFTGLVYLSFRTGSSDVPFFIPILLWLVVYTWLVSRRELIINKFRVNIAGMLFWLFVFSLSVSFIILSENEKKEWTTRRIIAERLSVTNDVSSERLLSIALAFLDNDFLFSNFHRFQDPDVSRTLKDSIITQNYSGYLNRFDTRLYVFDEQERGLYNDDPVSLDTLNTIISVQSRAVPRVPGLYYYETSYDKFNYITRREVVSDTGTIVGTVFILSTPKNFGSDALFPELFRQQRREDPENSPVYSYAIYHKQKLVASSPKYPFPIFLTSDEVPKTDTEKRAREDYDELWLRDSSEKVVVVARKQDSLIETITLFSYIFCAFLFMVALVNIASIALRSRYGFRELRRLTQFNIRNQVHSTIIFISLLSFIIIGIATISFFITRYERNNSDKLSRTMKIMMNEIQKRLLEGNTFNELLTNYDTAASLGLQKLVNDVADIHDLHVNVYDLDGQLHVTSEVNMYRKGVLNSLMHPRAYYHLNQQRESVRLQEESVGALSFLSIYGPVRDEQGTVYAYLNVPYFSSQLDLKQEISNFLVTIINLNAFIFLISGVIALFITNRITRSFSVISDKMKEVNLSRRNEAIEWNRDDEIGELVKEYNKMVGKLEESATALARSEREGAWREMARQVAHEIKNPLTPMKLSIQYLQKSIDNNHGNVKEMTANVAKTLVEQIDHLSKIAADFAQFANIGNTEIREFDLHEVLNSLKDLYRTNPGVSFQWKPLPEKVMLKADKTQMNRLFTNLFTNAVDACKGRESCIVQVKETRMDDMIRVSIKDNGEGIPEEMQDRIFTPNFTTKTSGTGLGLAMCKSIAEQAGGSIWFETEVGVGTTFYVDLPSGE